MEVFFIRDAGPYSANRTSERRRLISPNYVCIGTRTTMPCPSYASHCTRPCATGLALHVCKPPLVLLPSHMSPSHCLQATRPCLSACCDAPLTTRTASGITTRDILPIIHLVSRLLYISHYVFNPHIAFFASLVPQQNIPYLFAKKGNKIYLILIYTKD